MEQTLGKRIAENRKRLKLTQEQLSEKLGVTAQAVSKWENDQSCPDIGILPQLSQIFGISTDALLGCEETVVHTAQVVEDEVDEEKEGFHIHTDKGEISFNSGKHGAVQLAVWVILTGLLYLISQLLYLDISFWKILWPTALIVFGLFGVFCKFSMVALGSALVGGYFLAKQFIPGGLDFSSGVIFALIVVLFGIGLLLDALKKKHKPLVSFRAKNNASDQKEHNTFIQNEDSFTYHATFGEETQHITIPELRSGEIQCSFGEYRVDFSEVDFISDPCPVDALCSFGELTLLVPSRFAVILNTTTAFASVDMIGKPDTETTGKIHLDAHANFGQIVIEYI